MSTAEKFSPAFLEEVVGDRFGRYSKYIIQDRAIPDVRDGLKPVQRRILYAMHEAGNTADKPYRKSAKTVGDVMGSYHPHGDTSIYDGMVRMAQPWKMMHPLIDGHGNWGSLDDDPAAAMRYTEARLSPIASEMMRDLDKETVLFKDNFDNSMQEPVVLPARFPNLLVNGVSGISSGFATEIPTHNLNEVIDACIHMLKKKEVQLEDLMNIIQGPDFPTGGIIMGKEGIKNAYETGKGKIFIRSKVDIEKLKSGKEQLIITEIPYQVVKSKLVTQMENIRLDKKIDGIGEVRDESGRDGLKIVIELKKDADAQSILHFLYKKTDLQVAYHFNMVAIVNKTPKQLGIQSILQAYINHQIEVVRNRSQYELARAEHRAHILDGLVKALNILDEVIETIKQSRNRQDAQRNLVSTYGFTEKQADSILTLQLYRLTNLEITTLEKEQDEVSKTIQELQQILNEEKKLYAVIIGDLREIKKKYGQERRSIIQDEVEELKVNLEAMINSEDVMVTLTKDGYIKRTSMLSFTRSGGEPGLKEQDYVKWSMEMNTLHTLMVFTKLGQYYMLPVHQIPEYKWKDTGTALVNVISLKKEDQVISVIPIENFELFGKSVVFVSKKGQVKRTELKEYQKSRSNGIVGCKLQKEDEIIHVALSDNDHDILLITASGMSIRFHESEVNPMGRAATGVKGIQLQEGDHLIKAIWVKGDEGEVAVLSNYGYGKRSFVFDYPRQGRGGKGVLTFEFKEGKRVRKNGTELIYAEWVKDEVSCIGIDVDGAEHPFSSEMMPVAERKSTGKMIMKGSASSSIVDVIRRAF
ncbi:DNA gyrase subunit A [Longirhabdus pacifica]|uniref:DNA gyrase subunit A n=1 Tax=Longirhabdus pacifica TaxID=2305227 RepID=UPI0010092C56|nr:DNA gyrase subunit A [Longirhabdus pacifica]